MKTLQNNFTTPEQSKQLLELGLPADSADCYYSQTYRTIVITDEQIDKKEFYKAILPIWSVGRMIEISRICSTLPDEEWMFPFWKDQEDNIEWSIRVIESGIRTGNMDFSKLEE